jgi:hypothetical protein
LIGLVAGLLLPLSALSQQVCANPSFEQAVPIPQPVDGQVFLARQADGSYTGFEMTGENPPRLIRAVPNYGKALSACVDKKARSNVNPALTPDRRRLERKGPC